MKETDIRKYAELMKELGLTGLEMSEGDTRVRLERSFPAREENALYTVPEQVSAPQNIAEGRDYISVKSPTVGVFYAAPDEKAESYVKTGDAVNKGQVLCIIEAMKLMNEIVAEDDGVISEVCVTNGQVVEYGTELFRIKR